MLHNLTQIKVLVLELKLTKPTPKLSKNRKITYITMVCVSRFINLTLTTQCTQEVLEVSVRDY